MDGTTYPMDLTDEQWALIEPHIPPTKSGTRKGGRPPADPRTTLNGLMYLAPSGCQWRTLPREFGPWPTVNHHYRLWRRSGVLQAIHDALPAGASPGWAQAHPLRGDHRQPVGEDRGKRGARGYDAGKKTNGRKRHIVVDTVGLVVGVVVHAANIQDRDGAKLVLAKLKGRFGRLKQIWADGAYAGQLIEWTRRLGRWVLEIIKRRDDVTGFVVLPKRWIVEPTFSWFGRYTRLSKDCETLTDSSESVIYLAMTHLMVRPLRPRPI